MRGYLGLHEVASSCVRFVRASEVLEEDAREFGLAHARDALLCYVDVAAELQGGHVFDLIGKSLPGSNYPYGPNARVELLDDLVGLSASKASLILLVNGAGDLLASKPNDFFDLVELFLIQFHNWFSKGKPCYLCLQMERSPVLDAILATQGIGVRPVV